MKPLSGHTRPYAVLGHPIGHTLSPIMHNAAFTSLDMDAIYLAFDVAPDTLMPVLAAMKAMGFGGVNLTVPLKEVAFKGLTDLDETARRLGAVNTVRFTSDGMRGHNTDGPGFLTSIQESFGAPVAGKTLFVLGSGGAGRATAIAAAGAGAKHLILADIDEARSRGVANDISKLAPHVVAEPIGTFPEDWARRISEADLVVQATPIGMKADDICPLPASAFKAGQWAFDLVYNRPETCFMRAAKEGGALAVNGLGMLLHQGAEAFTIWTGQPAAIDVMRNALQKALYG